MSRTGFSLSIRSVTKEYGSRRDRFMAVHPLDLEVSQESKIGVIGESGSGKSTLARMIVGLEQPSEGSIAFDGRPVSDWLTHRESRREFRKAVQYVAQDTSSSFDPRKTMFEAVATPLRFLSGVTDRGEVEKRLETISDELSLDFSLWGRLPRQLSGGQRQRFALARSLVVEPRLLICDEVVSALDVSVQGRVLNLIKRYVERHGMGLMFVAHGLPAVAFISDEMLVMQRGSVVERGAVGDLLAGAAHPYTRTLLAAYAGPDDTVSAISEEGATR